MSSSDLHFPSPRGDLDLGAELEIPDRKSDLFTGTGGNGGAGGGGGAGGAVGGDGMTGGGGAEAAGDDVTAVVELGTCTGEWDIWEGLLAVSTMGLDLLSRRAYEG